MQLCMQGYSKLMQKSTKAENKANLCYTMKKIKSGINNLLALKIVNNSHDVNIKMNNNNVKNVGNNNKYKKRKSRHKRNTHNNGHNININRQNVVAKTRGTKHVETRPIHKGKNASQPSGVQQASTGCMSSYFGTQLSVSECHQLSVNDKIDFWCVFYVASIV